MEEERVPPSLFPTSSSLYPFYFLLDFNSFPVWGLEVQSAVFPLPTQAAHPPSSLAALFSSTTTAIARVCYASPPCHVWVTYITVLFDSFILVYLKLLSTSVPLINKADSELSFILRHNLYPCVSDSSCFGTIRRLYRKKKNGVMLMAATCYRVVARLMGSN
jgi:hypothetical protein